MLHLQIILIVANVCFVPIQSHGINFPGSSEPSTCRTATDEVGFCTRLNKCQAAGKLSGNGVQPTICGYDRSEPVICCPRQTEPLKENSTLTVHAPDLPIQCGSLALEHSPEVLSARRRRDTFSDYYAVAGGIDARLAEFPFMALLGKGSSSTGFTWFCSAVLINSRWVLTAAHCFRNGAPDVVRLGEHDYSGTHDNAPHKDYSISKVVPHPEYKKEGRFVSYHDLALIELASEVLFSAWITPICLPWGSAKRPSLGSLMDITGWGATEFGGDGSSILQVAQVELFPTETCNNSYALELDSFSTKWPRGITDDTFLCSGTTSGGIDTCQGDSGGPIVTVIDHEYVLQGIVSQGIGCGNKKFPGLYVPLTEYRYLAWIKETAFA